MIAEARQGVKMRYPSWCVPGDAGRCWAFPCCPYRISWMKDENLPGQLSGIQPPLNQATGSAINSQSMKITGFTLCIIVFILSLSLTALCYFPATNAWFVLDDYLWLEEESISEVLQHFHGSWGHCTAYRPIIRFSFALDCMVFGDDPFGWHMHNFILHACNATLLFILVWLVRKNYTEAVLIAVLFSTSPWAHENIAWISGRTHLLGGLFYLAALVALIKLCQERSSRYWVFLILSSVFFLLGLMSYEALFSFPLIAGLLLLSMKKKIRPRTGFLLAGYYVLLLLLFTVFRYSVLGQQWGATNPHYHHLVAGSMANAGEVVRIFFGHFRIMWFSALIVAGVFAVNVFKNNLKYISAFAMLSLSGLTLYLPFILVEGVAFRFLYLVQAVYLALVVQALISLVGHYPKLTWAFWVMFLCLVLANCKVSMALAQEWKMAGVISRSIPAAIKEIYPEKPKGYDFILSNVPDTIGHAGVFISYLDLAVRREYVEFDGTVYRTRDIAPDPLFLKRYEHPAKFFAFNKETTTLVEISREQWVSGLDR